MQLSVGVLLKKDQRRGGRHGEQERLTAASEVEDGAAAFGLDVGPTALGHDHLGVPADTCVRRVDENAN